MSARREILLRLAERDERVALALTHGARCEGWILDVEDDAIVFEHAPSPFYAQAHGVAEMAPPPERIPLRAIARYVDASGVWRALDE